MNLSPEVMNNAIGLITDRGPAALRDVVPLVEAELDFTFTPARLLEVATLYEAAADELRTLARERS